MVVIMLRVIIGMIRVRINRSRVGMRHKRKGRHSQAKNYRCASSGGPHGTIMGAAGCQFADMDQQLRDRGAGAGPRPQQEKGLTMSVQTSRDGIAQPPQGTMVRV